MNDILTSISDLFLGNGIIIVLGCFIVGTILKGSIKNFPNKFIPYINAVISIVLGFLIPGTFEDRDVVTKIILLAFLGLSSVGLYESLCIAFKDRFSLNIKQAYNNILKFDKSKVSNQTYEDDPSEEDKSDLGN